MGRCSFSSTVVGIRKKIPDINTCGIRIEKERERIRLTYLPC